MSDTPKPLPGQINLDKLDPREGPIVAWKADTSVLQNPYSSCHVSGAWQITQRVALVPLKPSQGNHQWSWVEVASQEQPKLFELTMDEARKDKYVAAYPAVKADWNRGPYFQTQEFAAAEAAKKLRESAEALLKSTEAFVPKPPAPTEATAKR